MDYEDCYEEDVRRGETPALVFGHSAWEIEDANAESPVLSIPTLNKATETMLHRALCLHADGYRAEEVMDELYRVISPDGARYLVDLRDGTCDCPCFRSRHFTGSQGQTVCKHSAGCRHLVEEQRLFARLFGREAYLRGEVDRLPVAGGAR